jgi:hypothetical protein
MNKMKVSVRIAAMLGALAVCGMFNSARAQEIRFDNTGAGVGGAEDSTVDPSFIQQTPATLTLSPASLTWSGSPGGLAAQQITVSNTGDLPSAAVTTGFSSGGSYFRVSGNNCGSGLAGHASCSLQVTPTISSGGSFTGTLDVSATGTNRVTAALSATVTDPCTAGEQLGSISLSNITVGKGWLSTPVPVSIPCNGGQYTVQINITGANAQYYHGKPALYFYQGSSQVGGVGLSDGTNGQGRRCCAGDYCSTFRACSSYIGSKTFTLSFSGPATMRIRNGCRGENGGWSCSQRYGQINVTLQSAGR